MLCRTTANCLALTGYGQHTFFLSHHPWVCALHATSRARTRPCPCFTGVCRVSVVLGCFPCGAVLPAAEPATGSCEAVLPVFTLVPPQPKCDLFPLIPHITSSVVVTTCTCSHSWVAVSARVGVSWADACTCGRFGHVESSVDGVSSKILSQNYILTSSSV